jgi:hypothetical protein
MSDVIRFLESLGSNAQLPQAGFDLNSMIDGLDVDARQRQALLDRDHATLADLLGGRRILRCSIFSPDEEESPVAPDGDVPVDEPGEAN